MLPAASVPRHVAIIMDGNGRWARERGLPRRDGHRAGAESVREVAEACLESGVEFLTLYAFSSQNWNRPKEEITALMKLLEKFLREKTPEIIEKGVSLRSIGNTAALPQSCQNQLDQAIQNSAHNKELTLILALSYGAREEITAATKRLLSEVQTGRLSPDQLDPETFSRFLDTAPYPDPDLLIRTSGEFRLSNFLLWQLSYAEIVVTKTLWPDFKKTDFSTALQEFSRRHRRYGAL